MQKIMFNDKYGLTKAVLEGRKTQTRRIAYDFRIHAADKVGKSVILPSGSITYMDGEIQVLDDMPKPLYNVSEEVAIAQSYKDAGYTHELYQETFLRKPTIIKSLDSEPLQGLVDVPFDELKGWNNKMFVRADLMPHRIRTTNVRIERLQDISDEDCLKEGIFECIVDNEGGAGIHVYTFGEYDKEDAWKTPKHAFAALIDKTCGKGTWDSNPYVFVYDFELVK